MASLPPDLPFNSVCSKICYNSKIILQYNFIYYKFNSELRSKEICLWNCMVFAEPRHTFGGLHPLQCRRMKFCNTKGREGFILYSRVK